MMNPYGYDAPVKGNQGGRGRATSNVQRGNHMRDPFENAHQLATRDMFGGMDIFGDMHKRMNEQMGKMRSEFGKNSVHNEIMSKHFGGDVFGGDPFGGMMDFHSGFGDMHKRMEKMMSNFGNMDIGSMGGQGNCVMKSYTMNSHIDKDGKRHVEKQFTNQAQARGKDGKMILEKQEMYKNSKTGEKRVAKERTLDDQGRKMVRQKYGHGEEQVFNHYNGFEEEHAGHFDNRWEDEARNMGFYEGVGSMLGYGKGPRAVHDTYKQPKRANNDRRAPNEEYIQSRGLGMPEPKQMKRPSEDYIQARGLGMPEPKPKRDSRMQNEPYFANTADLKGSQINPGNRRNRY